MKFYFKTELLYVEALEAIVRYNVGFTHDPSMLEIEIKPTGHDQLPIYDESIINHITDICKGHVITDNEQSTGLPENNVAR